MKKMKRRSSVLRGNMSFDIQGYFNTTLPTLFAKFGQVRSPEGAILNFRAQIVITGQNSGAWLIDLTKNPALCMIGVGPNPDVTLTSADTDFANYMANLSQPIQRFVFERLFTLAGNQMLVMDLQQVFKLHF